MDGMSLGKQIKRARMSLGISQQAVANRFGITRAAVAQWEADTTRPDQDKLLGLAALLNTSIGDLLEDGFALHDSAQGAKNYSRPPDVPAELNTAWPLLLPEEQAAMLADIKGRAAHNLAVMEMMKEKPQRSTTPSEDETRHNTVRITDRRVGTKWYGQPDRRTDKEKKNGQD